MKRKFYYITLTVAIILIALGYGFYYYYAPPIECKPYRIVKKNDDTIRVAYIGDSWAFFHHPYDKRITDSLSNKLNRPAKVTSLGYCGQTSKEIYKFFFNKYHMKCFLSKGYDYCFISAGINDSNKKMSTNYYKRSIDYIIQFLLANNITPILLEIPDYDIEKAYRLEIISRKTLRRLSCLVTGTPINCKQEFRQALNELLMDKKYGDSVQIIRYKTWNNNYYDDLKEYYQGDGMHLNDKGYAKLDSCIVETCVKLHHVRNDKG